MAEKLDARHLRLIAEEIRCTEIQVRAAAALMEEGATVAFVARYRKEATGGLDDDQLEVLAKRRSYFLDLVERRGAILKAIDEQGKLTDPLSQALHRATTKTNSRICTCRSSASGGPEPRWRVSGVWSPWPQSCCSSAGPGRWTPATRPDPT